VVVIGTNLKTGSADPVVKVGAVVTVVVASSPTEVTFTVPLLAVTGKVSITTADGNATAATRLTVIPRGTVGREALLSLTGYWRLSAASRAGEKGGSPASLAATHEAPRGMSHHPVARVAPCASRGEATVPARSLLRLLTSLTVA
jgi:IPT/TIG domain